MKLARDLLLVLLGAVIGNAIMSHAAPEFELMVGQTKFHERECGTWWQCGPYSVTNNSLISSSYLAGLKWTGETFGFRAGYTYLGDFRGRENIATVRDEDADKPVLHCDPVTGVECRAIYSGQGKARGFYLGPTVEHRFGNLSLLGEIGLLFYRANYDVRVCRFEDSYAVPQGNCFDFNHATGNGRTWYVGLGASYRMFRDASAVILYRAYYDVKEQGRGYGGDVGLTGGLTKQLLAGVQVSF